MDKTLKLIRLINDCSNFYNKKSLLNAFSDKLLKSHAFY